MKRSLFIIVLLLASSILVKAQVAQHAQPDSVIKLTPVTLVNGHKAYTYAIAGKIQTPQQVQVRLLAYAPSANEYHQAKNETTWAIVSTVGFALSSTAAIIGYVNDNKSRTTEHHSLTGAYIFTGVATAFFTTAVINLVEASHHKNKALKVYNQRYE
jgi:ABC-type Fe3+-siderophore transport system permease subunit